MSRIERQFTGAGTAQRRARRVVLPIANRLWRFNLEGFETLSNIGPAVLCPNHVSFLDSAFLMLQARREISFVGKAEYMDSWKTKVLFPMMGMIPIDRSGGDRSTAALDAAEMVLRRGELFGIFPEGTRSRDGMLYKGHTGAARLALRVGCPLIPVGVVGTWEIQPPDTVMPKFFRECTIRIGRPEGRVHRNGACCGARTRRRATVGEFAVRTRLASNATHQLTVHLRRLRDACRRYQSCFPMGRRVRFLPAQPLPMLPRPLVHDSLRLLSPEQSMG
ncbi:MAG: 1-acyl-sn-glycerol-3-phosphate acyltransferase [Ilumatobacteraceae bacterium]|nr:1-acyl-sn-glycerol-3-phosphate acyltransferase [Ilumatobacteraceae bacterium]